MTLAICYLFYVLGVPTSHLVYDAIDDSQALLWEHKASWLGDLEYCLSHLTSPATVASTLLPDATLGHEDVILKSISNSMETCLHTLFQSSVGAPHNHNCRERNSNGAVVMKTIAFRHYLQVAVLEHCHALMQLLVSDHCLAIEHLQWKECYHVVVPCHERL